MQACALLSHARSAAKREDCAVGNVNKGAARHAGQAWLSQNQLLSGEVAYKELHSDGVERSLQVVHL